MDFSFISKMVICENDNQQCYQVRTDNINNAVLFIEQIEKPMQEINPNLKKMSVLAIRTFLESYYETRVAKTTYNLSIQQAITSLEKKFPNHQVYEITAEDVENLLVELKKRLKASSFIIIQGVLIRILNVLKEYKYLPKHFEVKKIKTNVPETLPVRISQKDFEIFIKDVKPELRDIFIFLFFTGVRRREIINLRCSDIDSNNGQIIIGKSFRTKTNKIRYIPISKPIVAVLKRNMSKEKIFLFEHRGRQWKYTNFYLHIRAEIRRITGSDKMTIHKFRHSFATNMLEKGILSIYELKEVLGHSDIHMTEKYLHYDQNNLKDKFKKLKFNY